MGNANCDSGEMDITRSTRGARKRAAEQKQARRRSLHEINMLSRNNCQSSSEDDNHTTTRRRQWNERQV